MDAFRRNTRRFQNEGDAESVYETTKRTCDSESKPERKELDTVLIVGHGLIWQLLFNSGYQAGELRKDSRTR